MTPEDAGGAELGTPAEDALTKNTPVGKIRRIAESPCIAAEDDRLRDVAEALSPHHRVQTVAVVNAAGILQGIIPLRVLLDQMFLRVAPEEFLTEILDRERVEHYGRMVRARTARELMEEPVYVTAEDTIRVAFARMHDHDLEGLPVVDEELRPVGYLDRLELIKIWLKEHRTRESDAVG